MNEMQIIQYSAIALFLFGAFMVVRAIYISIKHPTEKVKKYIFIFRRKSDGFEYPIEWALESITEQASSFINMMNNTEWEIIDIIESYYIRLKMKQT